MARIHYLQHVSFEGLGSIEPWLKQQGHNIGCTRLYRNEPLPDANDLDWLIVMGGPMGIYDYDQHPWLKAEKLFIRACIDAGKTVLGICLGGQLIADTLGAKVSAGAEKEIGWFPIKMTNTGLDTAIGKVLSNAQTVFHWHGDTFAIPEGATHLCSSDACANQGYLYQERVLGLQFHLETTVQGAEALCRECANELTEAPYIQPANSILASAQRFQEANMLMEKVLAELSKTL